MPITKWTRPAPRVCDFCGGTFGKHFYDGATGQGWAIMCRSCHKDYGHGLGAGRGQKYDTKTLEKVDG